MKTDESCTVGKRLLDSTCHPCMIGKCRSLLFIYHTTFLLRDSMSHSRRVNSCWVTHVESLVLSQQHACFWVWPPNLFLKLRRAPQASFLASYCWKLVRLSKASIESLSLSRLILSQLNLSDSLSLSAWMLYDMECIRHSWHAVRIYFEARAFEWCNNHQFSQQDY